ncbi:MAG: polyprenyl synthetase [Planctomycetota bacterium]|nr:MAG: polyprenyl synthetase [Planctomycetota bacterium]
MAQITALTDVTGLVRSELDEVNRIVEEALAPEAPELQALLGHVGGYRGKQLRPAMLLLVAKALDGLEETHLWAAAIVEMIHTSTLVHDDILDGALIRRKLASLNAVSGPEVSVLVGDYIYAQAFHLSVGLRDQRCSRLLSRVTRVVCQGEITQMLHRYDMQLSEEQYLRVIGEKTAILYGASSELGAIYAEASPEIVELFSGFGYELGLAFQIIDDCLDVEGDEKVVGKSLGTDFGKGKLTLPFLHLLSQLDSAERKRFLEIFEDKKIPDRQGALLAEFDLKPGLSYAHEKADSFLRAALRRLDGLPRNDYVEALRMMADFVLHRRN